MRRTTSIWLFTGALAYALFIVGGRGTTRPPSLAEVENAVVLPAGLQTVLYIGDRYLAANIESARVLAAAGGADAAGGGHDYFSRLHQVVSDLNPCHEDNYYVANALLAWGGRIEDALSVLNSATRCRSWDEVPPFFLGYNLYFFKHDRQAAQETLFLAAERSTDNRVALQKFAIMLQAEAYPDPRTARAYLVSQRDRARDQKLKQMLDQRIGRLDGLIALRDAKMVFEKRFGKALLDPAWLLTYGILKEFPTDPLRLGYEYVDGQFAMREVKVNGVSGGKK